MFRPKPSHGKTNEWFKMNMKEYLAVLLHTLENCFSLFK